MADQRDDKSKFPLTGLFALLAMISGLLFYEGISLKTSRPVDKEEATNIFVKRGLVQSRLWQDPFEAIDAHRRLEEKMTGVPEEKNDRHTLDKLIEVLNQTGISNLRVVPVFVDGSPYVNGAESRLNDRYALVSALGAADYVPESGEYLRFFKWNRQQENEKREAGSRSGKDTGPETGESEILIPAELYFPSPELRERSYGKPVLVLWLREQDAAPDPLMFLDDLLSSLKNVLGRHESKIALTYDVLGPRSSATLSAMLAELKSIQPGSEVSPFNLLMNVRFFSPYATAEDTFLLNYSPNGPSGIDRTGRSEEIEKDIEKKTVRELLGNAGIELTRTISTDAVLAEQLLRELKRRQVDLKPCADRHCNPRIALISEWDTLYGRSLPRTFAAVAMNGGSGKVGPALEGEINKLRRNEWPGWIYPHSYLAGLDGELPAKGGDKSNDSQKDGTQDKGRAWYQRPPQGPEQNAAQRPEGRSQLDYVIRLAAALKQEETKNGEEFRAIGVLGSDVYDKLLILQALRRTFPRAIFFTTDLNARLSYPTEWRWTHNLIIASHFGLELQPDLQIPIPPFRDSYQTSLFYSALWALEHYARVDRTNCPDCFQLREDKLREDKEEKEGNEIGRHEANRHKVSRGPHVFSADVEPRLYEVGRHGAFDVSTDAAWHSREYTSIHPPRPDLEAFSDTRRNLKWIVGAAATAAILVLGVMLISSTAASVILKLSSSKWFWTALAILSLASYGAVASIKELTADVAKNEPFVLTEGISAWPTAAIGALTLLMSLIFLWQSWMRLKANETSLAHKFGLDAQNDVGRNREETTDPSSVGSREKLHSDATLPLRIFSRAVRYMVGLENWHQQTPGHFDGAHLWREYTTLGDLKNFAARCLSQVAIALCFVWLLMTLFRFPNIPCRGSACFILNDAVIMLSIAAMMLLIFYVIDVTLLCRKWVNCIAMNKINWPDETLTKIALEQGVGKQNLDEWMGIELIAERTTVIGNFIYFPFIVMFLLAISRHSYLDNWDFPVALIVIFILNVILIVGNALVLRRSAEKAKREAIKRLESRLTQLPSQTTEEIKQRQQIDWAINAIRNNQRGAFLPFTQHPIFGAAIALPSGGYGIVLLLEYLATGH
jgi:hypothetical protein